MIEFSPAGDGLYRQSFAGDTLNTAVYLARQFHEHIDVSYITGLGEDQQSLAIRKVLTFEQISDASITMVRDKTPGLYLIENDETGERYFQYWRNDSAARYVFDGWSVDQIADSLGQFDLIYFSGISLAILDPVQQQRFLGALEQLQGKVSFVFDPNYRAKLWPDSDLCRAAIERAASFSDIALVTADDHQALWDDACAADIAARWRRWGAREVVVKEGGSNCIIRCGERVLEVPPSQLLKPVDTTGAGDSFAAGYVGARALGLDPDHAARIAHGIAGQVIMHPGGVIDAANFSPISIEDLR